MMLLRAGRKGQVSPLRTVYLQVGDEPSDRDLLLGVVAADRLDSVLDQWNRGEPAADLVLFAEMRRAVIEGRRVLHGLSD